MLCALLVAACVLGSVPILEMGFNDDWSYAWTARAFAATGHLTYNFWVGAMVGLQAVWAGLLIRLFGFSFTLVRLSTLPFAAGCAALLYRLGRYAGLLPSFAVFGAAAVTLSPVFIPLAASFMTDVPGFFFWLACVYCALLALRAGSVARACGWLAAAAALGVAGGTVRQVVWIAPLTALPTVAWIRRRERMTVGAAAGLWFASAVAMELCLRWFHAQPNAAGSPGGSVAPAAFLKDAVISFIQIALGCLLLILPILAIHVTGWRERLRARSGDPIRSRLLVSAVFAALLAGLLAAGAWLGFPLWRFGDHLLLGNMMTAFGILDTGIEALGDKPEILTAPVLAGLGLAMFTCAGFTVAALIEGAYRWRKARSANAAPQPEATSHASFSRFALLTIPPCLIYTLAIVYRAAVDELLFDRYLIVILPVLTIPLLWHYQHAFRKSPHWAGWAVIGVFAWYGVSTTHDYMAASRARLQAATALTAAGIPRTRITAGLEYDGWTQSEHPAPTPGGAKADRPYPIDPEYWFRGYTPSIDPLYFVAYSRLDGLRDTRFRPVPYTAWTPPFHRWVYTQIAPAASVGSR